MAQLDALDRTEWDADLAWDGYRVMVLKRGSYVRFEGLTRRDCAELFTPLRTAIAALPSGVRLMLDPASDDALELAGAADVTIVSGPEGGLAPDELEALTSFTSLGLGPRVLRAETAPVIAVAMIRAVTRS